MSRRMFLTLLFLCAFAVSSYSVANVPIDKLTSNDVQGIVEGKKIISFMSEFYRAPAAKIASMIDKMQEVEMDGISINFFPDDKGNKSGMMHRWFGMVPREYETFKKEIDIFKSINWGRYKNNFIYSCTSSHFAGRAPYDWFSEEDTAIWLKNAELLGRIAKETGCVGIILDTEQYGGGDYGLWTAPFSYTRYSGIAKNDPTELDKVRSFDECASMIRKRGLQWVKALTKHYPDIKILILVGSHSNAVDSVINLEKATTTVVLHDYRLQPAFFDGVLEGATANLQLIDGREKTYHTMEYRDFLYERDMALRRGMMLSALPELYKKHIRYAAAHWPDADMIWNMENVNKNHKTPLQFEHTLYNAMAASDEYVWLWSNKAYFFPEEISENLQKYRDAFAKARKSHALDWKQGKSFAGFDSPEVAKYYNFQNLDDLLTKTIDVVSLPSEGWKFMADPFSIGEKRNQFEGIKNGYFKKDYNDTNWPMIKIGQIWETQGYPDLNGNGWYRKTIKFPELPTGKKVYFHFGAVDESAWLYIDGKLVAWHEQHPQTVWDKPFALEVTESVKSGGTHQITIRVQDVSAVGGIWKPVKIIVEK